MNERRKLLIEEDTTGRSIIDGYEVVDFGLPSGILWATYNVGAASETDIGNYYMYGKGSRRYNSSDSMYTGQENPLFYLYDTARQVMGVGWRTPTKSEVEELLANTNYTYETNFNGSGVNGYKATSKTNQNIYIFIPNSGRYLNGLLINTDNGFLWTSTPYGSDHNDWSYRIYANINGSSVINDSRHCGMPVRPVHDAI